MSDVAAIIERLYRTYLYPPDARPAQCFLNTDDLSSTNRAVFFKQFVLPEDEELVAVGTIIEIDSELMQVVEYDPNTLGATVNRGVMGTEAVAHSTVGVEQPIILSPPYPRLSVFNAVADNIITLYPRLYTVTAGSVSSVMGGVCAVDDALAVEVVEAWEDGGTQGIDAKMVDYHQAVGGRALITNVRVGQVWIRYRRRFGDAQAETDTWESLGFEERWANIVMAGAAGDLFAGRDLPASHTEWVGAALQAETIPVGTRSQLSRQLLTYKEYLITQAQKEMRAEYGVKAHMRGAGEMVVRSAF
jgi:hypothetical protein